MMSSRYVLAFAAVLAAGGCMVGPDYKRPPPADPPSPDFKETTGPVVGAAASFQPAMPRDAIDRGPWWSIYGDPTLDRLAAQIDISNQTLMQAEAAYRQARALVRQDAVGPLSHGHRQRRLHPERQRRGSAAATQRHRRQRELDGSVGQFSARARALNWEIDLWGRIRRQIESDLAAAQASAADLANARLSAQANMAINYFSHAHLRAAHAALPGVGGGLRALAADRAEPGRCRHRRAASTSPRRRPSSSRRAPSWSPRTSPAPRSSMPSPCWSARRRPNSASSPGRCRRTVPTVDAGIPSTLLERRPDIASAERQMAAANAQIGVAVAAYYPNISLAQHRHLGRRQPERAAHAQQRGVVGRPAACRRR